MSKCHPQDRKWENNFLVIKLSLPLRQFYIRNYLKEIHYIKISPFYISLLRNNSVDKYTYDWHIGFETSKTFVFASYEHCKLLTSSSATTNKSCSVIFMNSPSLLVYVLWRATKAYLVNDVHVKPFYRHFRHFPAHVLLLSEAC